MSSIAPQCDLVKKNFRRRFFEMLSGIFFRFPFRALLAVAAEKIFVTTSHGEAAFPFIRVRQNPCFQILTYHRVNDDNDWVFTGMPSRVFRAQMEYLRENWNVLSLSDAVRHLKHQDLPERGIVVTFDDGYADNYTNAFPILCEMEISATFFLVTQAVATGMVIWHDHVFHAFRHTQKDFLNEFGFPKQSYTLQGQEQKTAALLSVLAFIRTLDPESRDAWIARLHDQLDVMPLPQTSDLMMNWEQVRVMKARGNEFGSHTTTHPILSRMSVNDMEQEIMQSQKVLTHELGLSSFSFAYPNGTPDDFNDKTIDLLQDHGFDCAVTTIPGNNDRTSDLFRLRRSTPWDQGIEQFAFRLHTFKMELR